MSQTTGQEIELLPYEDLEESDFVPPAVFRRQVELVAKNDLVWVGTKPQFVSRTAPEN